MTKKVAIIGAGHNGLVAACYMARAGHDVTIYEARDQVGGLASSAEVFPGFRSSLLANWHGMLMPEIIDDFNLAPRMKTFNSPFVSLHMKTDEHICFAKNIRHDRSALFLLRGMSDAHEKQWHDFWVDLGKASKILHANIFNLDFTIQKYQNLLVENGLPDVADSLFARSFMDYTLNQVDHPSLVTAILTMGFDHPCSIGSLYEVIYLGIANAFGTLGQWGFLQGGMGKISELLADHARSDNVDIHLSTQVKTICPEEEGCIVETDKERKFDIVLSSVDPWTMFQLIQDSTIPKEVGSFQPFSSKAVIHLKLSDYPFIAAFDRINRTGEHKYQGAIDFAPNLDDYKKSYAAMIKGELYSEGAIIASHIPSSWDSTMGFGKNGHLWTLVNTSVPARLASGTWGKEGKQAVLDALKRQIGQHVDNLDTIIEDAIIYTPDDIRDMFRCSTASCVHLPMTEQFSLEKRFRDPENPYTVAKNVYMCGAGSFPNGNVSGAPGYLCSHHLIQKISS